MCGRGNRLKMGFEGENGEVDDRNDDSLFVLWYFENIQIDYRKLTKSLI